MSTVLHSPALPARPPVIEVLVLAGPTVAQMASYNVMQLIDTWMLAQLGTDAATTAANAGMIVFAALAVGLGVLSLVNSLVSQSFGRGDFVSCGRYLWQGLWFCLIFAVLILPLGLLGAPVFRAMGHSAHWVALEVDYLQIVLSMAVLKLGGFALAQFLLAINRPGAVFLATLGGVLLNIAVAWVLILGRLGVPSLGVVGAAWAQNIGVALETALLAAFVLRPRIARMFHVGQWRPRWAMFRTLLAVGLPAGLQFSGDVLPWSLFLMWIMRIFGEPAVAANTFMFRYMAVSFMPAVGIGTAVTALVGRYIGMARPDLSEQRARLGFVITAIYMVGCGVLFYVARGPLMAFFTHDPQVQRIGQMMLIFAAVYQVFDAMYIIYNGALRGAGDTFVPGLVTATLCWGLNVGGAYAVARLWPQLGPAGPWLVATSYGVTLGVFMYLRFNWGRWRSIRLGPTVSPAD
jgi:MATE family multidrug resistance protein